MLSVVKNHRVSFNINRSMMEQINVISSIDEDDLDDDKRDYSIAALLQRLSLLVLMCCACHISYAINA